MAKFRIGGGSSTTTVVTAGNSYPALDKWPTEATLRLAQDKGGFLAFRYTGTEAGRYKGDYENPSCGIAATAAFVEPVLTPGNSFRDDDGKLVNVVAEGELMKLGAGRG